MEMVEAFVASTPLWEQVLDEFNVCELISRAYKFAVTHARITRAFMASESNADSSN